MIPFPYMDYRNVGYPRYFVNYDTGEDALEVTDNERFNSWTSSNKGRYQFYPNRKSLYELMVIRPASTLMEDFTHGFMVFLNSL